MSTSPRPILSILIPTCNRSQHLQQLLLRLQEEACSVSAEQVEIVVGDNASIDKTPQLIASFCDAVSFARGIIRSTDIGSERNFQDLAGKARGAYFWMIGDDDLPCKGALSALINFLSSHKPSLLYLPPIWLPDASDPVEVPTANELKAFVESPLQFAAAANMQVAFISSWVVSVDSILNTSPQCFQSSRYYGTNLIQLTWILPLIGDPASTLRVAGTNLLTAALNYRGDYQVIRTFGIAFPAMLNSLLQSSPRLRRCILHSASLFAFPSLIFYARSGARGNQVFSFSQLRQVVKLWAGQPFFWILCLPVLLMPPSLAKFCVAMFRRLRSHPALS